MDAKTKERWVEYAITLAASLSGTALAVAALLLFLAWMAPHLPMQQVQGCKQYETEVVQLPNGDKRVTAVSICGGPYGQ